MEAAGYAVATASATDVTGLGAVSCASGYRLADGSTPASAVCAVDGGEFAFAGCELITCAGSVTPFFLRGFDLTGLSMPALPTEPRATAMQCLPGFILTGSTPLSVSCGSDGVYVCDSCDCTSAGLAWCCGAQQCGCVPGRCTEPADAACLPCTPIANSHRNALVTCTAYNSTTNTTNSKLITEGCDASSDFVPGATEAEADRCIARTCNATSAAAMLEQGYAVEEGVENYTSAVGPGRLRCAEGYLPVSLPSAEWRMLLRQTAPNFMPTSDWIRHNAGNYGGDFSELDELESCRKDGKLHMKLVWPNIAGANSNEWKQESNPVTATGGGVTGYEPVAVNFDNNFFGLEKNGGPTLLDGNPGGTWWFAVGSRSSHGGANSFPGPNNIVTDRVELWAMCGSPAGQDGPEAICDAHGEIQLYGCVEISCAGSSLPPFLVGIDLTLYDSGGDLERSLPAVYTDPPLTDISACVDSHPLVSWDGPSWEPLTVRCGLSGEYEKVSGDFACAPCTPVANQASITSFPCEPPHVQWTEAASFCDSSHLTELSTCEVANTWTQEVSGFCSNPALTTELECIQYSGWLEVAGAFCSGEPSVQSQAECEAIDGPTTSTHSFVTSDVLALSAEFLRVPTASRHQVDVAVNGLAAACTAASGCGYEYSETATDYFTSVAPTTGGVGTEIVIEGVFASANEATVTVSIGPSGGCDVTSVTNTTVTCTVNALAMGGEFPLEMHVEGRGRVVGTATFSMGFSITSITPSQGSLRGGTVVTIEGEGFSDFGPYNQIEIGGIPCIPRTYKNLECAKDAVSMGVQCNRPIVKAQEPVHVRQFGEWFDFSSSTSIQCRIVRGVAADLTVDVVVRLIDPQMLSAEHMLGAINAASRGSQLERMTGGCEELASCIVLDEQMARHDTPHSCAAVESCALAKMYPINPDMKRICEAVDISSDDSAADRARCEQAGTASGLGPCVYVDGAAATAADCEAQMLDPKWNDEPWGARDSNEVCRAVPGCAYVPMRSARFGEDFVFTGASTTLAGGYTFAQAATPTVTRITPETGMPGSRVEIFGQNLAAPLPVSDTNFYMSRFGFFEQPIKATVHLGEDAPCAVVAHTDTYIRCVAYRNTMTETFPLSVDIHGAGYADHAIYFTFDLFVSDVSLPTGSIYGGTTLRLTGGGFAVVHNTYGEAVDGSAVGAFMGSSLVTPRVTLCDPPKPPDPDHFNEDGVQVVHIPLADGAAEPCQLFECVQRLRHPAPSALTNSNR